MEHKSCQDLPTQPCAQTAKYDRVLFEGNSFGWFEREAKRQGLQQSPPPRVWRSSSFGHVERTGLKHSLSWSWPGKALVDLTSFVTKVESFAHWV